ncbi:MAG: TonB-dependent receptor [Steroidobacteraceae bacterium]
MIVTGIRRSNTVAIESKLNAANIVDVVSATDVRALPDLTIVEALRRVPGLAVLPAIDNEHPRDEASTPVIRGLGSTYNNVTVDGLTIASPGTPNGNLGSVTRGVRLDILPSSMISEIQVVKTFTADLDPNAIGGAINLRTRSAFENGGKPFFTIDSSAGQADDTGKPRDQDRLGVRVATTGSTTFGEDGNIGIVVSGNYQTLSSYTETHMTTDTVHYGFYDAGGVLQTGTNLGNGFAVPQQDKYWYVMDERERYGLTGKLEARLTDAVTTFATAGYYHFRDDMERNELLIDPRNRNQVFDQTATTGRYNGGAIEVGYSNQVLTSKTKVGQLGMEWTPGVAQLLSVRGSFSKATYDEPIQMFKYITGVGRNAPGAGGATVATLPDYAFSYDTSSFNGRFDVAPAAFYNLANYSLFYWRPDYKRTAADEIRTGRIDYAFNQDSEAQGLGFALGGSYTDDRPEYNVDRVEYSPNTSAPALSLADVLGPSGSALKYTNGLTLLTIDPAAATAILSQLPMSAFNLTDQRGFNNQDDFRHQEKNLGVYTLATYNTERLRTQAGLRYEQTEQSTVGRVSRNRVWQDIPTSSDYDFLLPSLLLTWHLADDIDVRAGVSRTIGRPPYDAYAARSSINFVNSTDIGNPNATGVTVTIGNPDIEPRRSDNLDLAFDWRLRGPAGGGLLSLAVFDKDIEDEIFTLSSVGFTDDTGVTYVNALVSRPANASSAGIRGVELNGILNSLGGLSPWLQSVGFSANAAFLDGELTVPTATGNRSIDRLVGQPDYTANATLFYNQQGLEVRLAYNRQGRALRAVVDNTPWQDLYWDARQQLDASASYAVTPQWSVIAQVSNLTGERMTSLTGPGKDLLKDSYSVPTTYWLGVRWTASP